jgi:hypothetical protein
MRRSPLPVLGMTILAGLAALSLTATTATAGITGPCTASIAGTSVADRGTGATAEPIVVDNDSSVPVVMGAQQPLSHVKFTMQFAWFSWTVKDKDVSTNSYSDTIPVKRYARYGVGLYKVEGEADGTGLSCSGDALVEVDGNPFTSIAGIVGVVITLLGAVGVLAGGLGGRGAAGLGRVLGGLVAGVLLGLGVLVLLQQAAVVYPTPLVAIIGLAAGIVLGTATAAMPGMRPGRGAAP